jgi:predicted glycoside hydrolase/deacetylase ChbG (UPF0249 family)
MRSLARRLGYTDKDILVITNIDDIGMHGDATEASFQALSFGLVTTGSVMVPCPDYSHVVRRWKESPETDLGVHLTLTCEWGARWPWKPILPPDIVPSLYNPDGIMWASTNELLQHAAAKEIYMELDAQIRKMLEDGMKPSHVDHHMDFYYQTELFTLVMALSRKYHLPMRVWRRRRYRLPFIKNNLVSLRRKGFIFPDTQMGLYGMKGHDQSLATRKRMYHEYLRSLKPGVHNVKLHIAFNTENLQQIMGTNHAAIRQIDHEVWTSDDTRRIASDLGISFIGFRPLQRLQRESQK